MRDSFLFAVEFFPVPELVTFLTVSPVQKRTAIPSEVRAEFVVDMLGPTNCSTGWMFSSGNRFSDDAGAR
jgi:hypothetical protein